MPQRKKIAILGGGVGALSTAFALTDSDNPHHDQYEITIYQMGWRLGGKGASGRNMEPTGYYRIEEHGLHVWFGFYNNAFHMMRKCYTELRRSPDAPLATWQDAFKPHSLGVAADVRGDIWQTWPLNYPTNDDLPGEGELLPLWDYMAMAVAWMCDHFKKSPTDQVEVQFASGCLGLIHKFVGQIETKIFNLGLWLLHLAHGLARLPHRHKLRHRQMGLIRQILNWFMGWYWADIKDTVTADTEQRQHWILLNFAYANLCGAIEEDIFAEGFDALNDEDYLAWLRQYVFPDGDLTLKSPFVSALYYGGFAYLDGDINRPNLEAGTALRFMTRTFLTYRGAVMWKMQAGMGDVVFAPLYQVLKQRGVKFKFFHQVKRVCPSTDGKFIESIELACQAQLKPEQEAKGGYEPLINIKGLPCWPSAPLYDQLVNGEQLRARDLESYYPAWSDEQKITLKREEDFDEVILGISLGALPYICGDLITASDQWKKMVDRVKTIRTQAFQLWLKPTAYELGWKLMGRPIVSYNLIALNTWGDMSQLIDREGWPAECQPLNIAYFCGPLLDDSPLRTSEFGPTENCENLDQYQADQKVHDAAINFLNKQFGLWPNAVIHGTGPDGRQFNWEFLVDARPGEHQGSERFDSQYWVANVQPSERYVLSVVDSSQYRLPAHDPDEFRNLYLAGDWTANGLNMGCVEAAAMSGLLASSVLTGYPDREDIIGLDF
ncbi:MAG: NAD(P)-binding protein [Chloroflexi bacterium]|nr:NAD(P)-binding protein [Chloroflexota bacterium]